MEQQNIGRDCAHMELMNYIGVHLCTIGFLIKILYIRLGSFKRATLIKHTKNTKNVELNYHRQLLTSGDDGSCDDGSCDDASCVDEYHGAFLLAVAVVAVAVA